MRVESSESGQTSGDGTCYCGAGWWLRSPSYSSVLAASVNPDGSVFNFGHAVNLFSSGVRPALWLKY
ncbi:MAG: hypothetical protein IIY06_09965 [Proteobacteria bacterium]|nr:hypothetical protein [Pseudomonadota bacterium]